MKDKLFHKNYGDTVLVSDLNKKTRAQINDEVDNENLNVGKAMLMKFDNCYVGVSVYCVRRDREFQYEYIIREKSTCTTIKEWAEKHSGGN